MKTAELDIAHLNLHLPAELQSRAKPIANMLAQQLTQLSLQESKTIPRLSLKNIQIKSSDSNQQIAQSISRSIKTAIEHY